MDSIGVYIHIPFCQVRCSYCDFNTYAGLGKLIDDYIAALCNEIEGVQGYSAATIYFGGGTPSLLSETHLHRVLVACRASFDVSADAEITLEANPGTVTADSLRAMRKLGVNRLSLGAQSLDDDMLHLLDRLHNAQQAREALALARRAGFDNVSLDFMYGLPGQTLDHWRRTLDQAIALQPEHLSLYALTLEEHTPMFQRVASGDVRLPDDDTVADMYTLAEDALDAAGYLHYEISNWSSSVERMSRHNSLYWRRRPYRGFGAGAHSFDGDRRFANVLHPRDYIERMRTTGSALGESETLTPQMARAETMFLGLRLLIDGVRVNSPSEGCEPSEGFQRQIGDLVQAGLLEVDDRRVRLTRRGRLLSNQVFVRFME
jgi:oxygen-independent coproporphyrinogen-3 oxidase